jgi:hypothetical protein
MNIIIRLSNNLISKALCDFLKKELKEDKVVVNDENIANTFKKPDIILVDII